MCFTNLYCSGQYDNLLHKSYSDRYQQIDSTFYYNWTLRSNKPLFFKQLDILEKAAKQADDKELVGEALLLQLAENSTTSKHIPNKITTDAKAIIAYAAKEELTQIELRCRQFLGRYYMEKTGDYIEGIDQFIKSYYLLKTLPISSFPTKKEHMYNVAHAYYVFGDFEGAKKYLVEAMDTKMPSGVTITDDPNKVITYMNLENTLGLIPLPLSTTCISSLPASFTIS